MISEGLGLEIKTSLSTRQGGIVSAALALDSKETRGVFRENEGLCSCSSKGDPIRPRFDRGREQRILKKNRTFLIKLYF